MGRAWSSMVDQAVEEARATEDLYYESRNRHIAQRAKDKQIYADRSPYGPQSKYSFFADQALAKHRQEPEARERLERDAGERERLIKDYPELRSVLTSGLGAIVPGGSGMPAWTAEAVAAAVRSAAPLASALLRIPLPGEGTTIPFGKFTSGSTGAVQNPEGSAITEGGGTAPGVSFDNEPFSTIATWIGVSFQAVERSGGAVDAQIAQDLGAAYGAKLESELWTGTGSSGRIRGLNSASWGTTKTLAAQTLADHLLKIHDAWQSADVALGQPPDLIAMHPRRYAFLQASATNVDFEELLPAGVELVASPGQVTNLGGGTNEDWIMLVNRASTPLATDPPSTEVHTEALGSTIQANYLIHGYSAFATARRPEGLAVVKGGTTPTF